jgi:CO/xanthine dehydrogenase Mo-binding subunit
MTRTTCPEQFTFPARHLYAARTFKLAQEVADMDMLANTFMRAPGESVGTFALECALDELADKLGIDPIELRRRIEPDKDPTTGHAIFVPPSRRGLSKGSRALRLARTVADTPSRDGARANG